MYIFDLEADGLNPSKIHCTSVSDCNGNMKSTNSYKNMRKFFSKSNVLIGHNITLYDIPVLERLLDIKIEAKLVDTLALSWYLEPGRLMHGLASYGEDFGIPKPKIDDWDNLTTEEYIHRCEEDVKINTKLWNKQWKQLLRLYGSEEEAWRLVDYLSFKMSCAREQERLRWKLDVVKCTNAHEELCKARESKITELASVMPSVPIKALKTRPKKPFKQDGSHSVVGETWFNLLKENNLPEDYDSSVEVITGYKEPNPGSVPQIKDWLYSFGWEPETFEYKRNKETGDVRKIPQVNIKNSGGEICQSIHKLFDVEPKLKVLEGLSILTHRIGILEGFLGNVDEDGFIQAQIQGLTNTLRFKHKTVVNLPGTDKPYGSDIRGCLIAPSGYELVGSDMSSLEDRTKQHYMWNYDPEYVKEMMTPDFDPHIDIAVHGKALTKAQGQAHKDGTEDWGAVRKKFKAVNYAAVYGAGAPTISRAAGVTEGEATKLIEAYWGRNWSVRAIADDCVVKTCGGTKWLYNPVSRFWYSLRYEKDRFSTLNQGTGVYCFDRWVGYLKSKGLPIIGQMHDEVIGLIKTGNRERATKVCKWAVGEVNKELKLNRELDCSVSFGDNYAEIH